MRCATVEEHQRILRETERTADTNRVFVIESGESADYVVAMAVGWQEDDQDDRDPSELASFAPATDPTRILPADSPIAWSAIQAADMPDWAPPGPALNLEPNRSSEGARANGQGPLAYPTST